MKADFNNTKACAVCAVFLVILILPSLLFPFIKSNIDTTNYENRVLAERPELDPLEIEKFPALYESYYNDHLPFKNQFVKLNTWLELNVFKSLSSEKVILGKNNWLFYKNVNDCDPLGCYKGTNLLTEQELKQFTNVLVETNNNMKNNGKDFVFMVAPNKEQVYSEFMPNNIKVNSDFSRADQLYEYLVENTDIKVVYPFKEMLEYKNDYQLYHKYDTHWNSLGAFIGTQQILEKLGDNRIYLEDIEYTSKGNGPHDLANMVHLSGMLKKQPDILIKNYHSDIIVEKVEESDDSFYQKFSSDINNNKKALVLGDSFRTAMIGHITANFSETNVYHYHNITAENFRASDCNVVILETVERYLMEAPKICRIINEGLSLTDNNN